MSEKNQLFRKGERAAILSTFGLALIIDIACSRVNLMPVGMFWDTMMKLESARKQETIVTRVVVVLVDIAGFWLTFW